MVGLTLWLASSAAVFPLVKYAGAVYLVALGLYLLTRPRQEQDVALERSARDLWRVYIHAVMVNVLNPKVGIFFLAFSPSSSILGEVSLPRSFCFSGQC